MICFNLSRETRFKLRSEKLWCFDLRIRYVRALFIISSLLVLQLTWVLLRQPITNSIWVYKMIQWLEKLEWTNYNVFIVICFIPIIVEKIDMDYMIGTIISNSFLFIFFFLLVDIFLFLMTHFNVIVLFV